MAAFLDCLNQLVEYINQMDPDFAVPYRIIPEKARLEDLVQPSVSKEPPHYSVKYTYLQY